jgi:hypothetical protein
MPVKTNKAPKTTTTTSEKQKYSLTQETRNAIREAVFACEDTREFHPLDYALIRPIVKDAYLSIFDAACESGESCMVEIDLNKGFDPSQPITENAGFVFVHNWLRANGKNRNPNENHYGELANGFRGNFVPDATHWVVDTNGMVANGGHSGRATALSFYPPCVEYGVEGKPVENEGKPIDATSPEGVEWLESFPGYYYESNGEVFETSLLPWLKCHEGYKRPGEYETDDKGNETYIEGTDSPDVRTKQNLTIRLVINANPQSCLKMDDVRLEASFDDYLQMVAPIRSFMVQLPKDIREKAGEIFRNYYLRVNHKGESFGSLGKGGRLTKNEVQQWFMAGIPHLLDSIALLSNDKGLLDPMLHFKKPQGGRGGVSYPIAVVAMMVSSPSGRERIAELLRRNYVDLTKAPKYFQDMVAFLCLAKGDPQAINADMIVQTLVLWGEGATDPVAKMKAQYPDKENAKGEMQYKSAWQVETNRAMGWDRSNTDSPVEEEFTSVCIDAATRIAEILGSEGDVKNAKMKATRKGAGSRGKNKGK